MKHQIVKLVCEKAGISEEQSTEAVETVIGYFRNRLPAEIAEQIDNLAHGHNGGNGPEGGSRLLQ
ncbi:hypothetical protein [Paenibacillus hamazuiensis]|uniref:hypothetical protein n=1 Tax=Paenibacillus hamazuiensis TaxID=2936508 RepID=UPI002010630A|nr:hypothetical protein [Paenibacillus hamazuiensis]